MAPETPPGSTDRTPGTPPAAPSVPTAPRRSYVRNCVVLVDWWLERVEGKICVAGFTETPQTRKGASSSKGNRRAATRVFRSAVARRYDFTTLETVDGYVVRIGRLLNFSRTRENGFSQEVCECFESGFPIQWEKLVNPNMAQMDGQSQSPSKYTADAPSGSVEYYMEKFLSDSFINTRGYAFAEKAFNSSTRSPSNTNGPPNQMPSSFPNGNTGNNGSAMSKMAASEGSGDGRMDMPEGPFAPPGETCSSGEADDQHERLQIDASEHETVDRSITSVLVDGNMSAPSKNASVEKEGYRGRVGCGQAEQDAEIHHENMRSCSSEQEMVTHPVVADLVNNHMSRTSSDLGGTPRCGKTSVNPGIGDALEVPTEGMTPEFGVVRVSEDNTVRRLRSGKVFGVPSSVPVKRDIKRKRMQHEASNNKMVPNEGVTPTADLTSHENGCSVARTVAKNKLQSHENPSKGRGRPAKRGRRGSARREAKKLFYNWL